MQTSSKLVLAAAVFAARCSACTIVTALNSEIPVGSNFKVKAQNHGQPVSGLPVVLDRAQSERSQSNTQTRFDVRTAKNGMATFRNVPPGHYYLYPALDTNFSNHAELQVNPAWRNDSTIPLQWPSREPIAVRSLKGTIHSPDYIPGHPEPKRNFDLLEAVSAKWLKTFQTDDAGAFDLATTKPGLYFLRLDMENIFVEVAPNASLPALDLDIGWTSCGLYYTDQSKCRLSDLHANRLSGEMVDGSGAAILGAKILLLDPTGAVVEQTESDGSGQFSSNYLLNGTYQLDISKPGFTHYHRTLRAEFSTEPSAPIRLELGVLGNCGRMDQK